MNIFSIGRRGRTSDFVVTLTDTDGTNSTISVGDVVRVKIGRTGATPILDLDSAAPSDNGSTVGGSNPVALHIDQVDMSLFDPGIYDMEVSVVDLSIGSKIIQIETGVFEVIDPMGGDVGTA